jgi:hypothetical protein
MWWFYLVAKDVPKIAKTCLSLPSFWSGIFETLAVVVIGLFGSHGISLGLL